MHQSTISQLTDKNCLSDGDALSTKMTSPQQLQTLNQFGQNFYQYTPSTNMNSSTEVDYEHMEKNKKRSRRVLSLKERIEVIKIAETRRDTRELALKFECGRTQILSILSQKERLLKEWANDGDPNRLRRRPSAMSLTTNKVIYEWLYRCKCAQLPLTDIDILEKAYEAKHLFKYSEFRPNRRWLDRFKKRFRIQPDELISPDPTFFDGVERSLELRDIYEDIKDTIELNTSDDQPIELPSLDDQRQCVSYESMMNYDQTMSSSNDICEIEDSEDDEQNYSPQNFCETEFSSRGKDSSKSKVVEDDDKPIANNEQALACLKKLEEYSMLKDDFRAIGYIVQLEKIYKGEIES
ncbi:uncharacterized protein LOC129909169 isoform X2 [Episyrphus balteatus]|uniref:uncharacterized protein LOC129909169 isoform X2 n=1 Tax=Episyrphus balteatus TaxID=286459 RepID=UPI002486AB56|nr:uncharacterized protein LOC129909169 isoform X2 [Episyrphus balteatus]